MEETRCWFMIKMKRAGHKETSNKCIKWQPFSLPINIGEDSSSPGQRYFWGVQGLKEPIYLVRIIKGIEEIKEQWQSQYSRGEVETGEKTVIFQFGIDSEPDSIFLFGPTNTSLSSSSKSRLLGQEVILESDFLYLPFRIDLSYYYKAEIPRAEKTLETDLLKRVVFPITMYLVKHEFLNHLLRWHERLRVVSQFTKLKPLTVKHPFLADLVILLRLMGCIVCKREIVSDAVAELYRVTQGVFYTDPNPTMPLTWKLFGDQQRSYSARILSSHLKLRAIYDDVSRSILQIIGDLVQQLQIMVALLALAGTCCFGLISVIR